MEAAGCSLVLPEVHAHGDHTPLLEVARESILSRSSISLCFPLLAVHIAACCSWSSENSMGSAGGPGAGI